MNLKIKQLIYLSLSVIILITITSYIPLPAYALFPESTSQTCCTLREHNQGASLIPVELSTEEAADVGQTLRDMSLHFRGLTRRITSEPPATLYELSLWHEDDQTFTVWVDRKHLYLPLRAGFFVCFSPASGTDTLFSTLSRLHAAA